jgi:hypothetical protein
MSDMFISDGLLVFVYDASAIIASNISKNLIRDQTEVKAYCIKSSCNYELDMNL